MRVDRERLDRTLNPRTVVVVGDAKARGNRWLKSNKTVEDVDGRLFSVQVDPNELPEIEALGVENFSSLLDIPGEVDYVLVAVPRQVAPLILKHCIEKNVAGAAFFTSGFAETDTDEGRELQSSIQQAAVEAGLVLIGPNCMGLYNPAAGVRFGPQQPAGFDGPVSFVSQSGAHAMDFIMAAHDAGVRLGKAVSFGNGIVLENADYLEYFADDPGTEYLAMYVEGLQDGRRFFEQLRAATRRKPVVLWKGGRSSDGSRATRSHTASLAGSTEVWDALCRQAGALQAESLTEAVDLLKALTLLPPFTGDGVGVMGGSGGQSVSMTDAFAGAGLRVPELTEASYTQLGKWFSLVGASFRNPIDMGTNRTELEQILGILDGDANIDVISMQLRPRPKDDPDREQLEAPVEALALSKQRSAKPHVVLLHSPTPLAHGEAIRELDQQLHALGIPAFPGYERAARALAKVGDYYRWRADAEASG
jgi:acyl-CoA synthetase (NDP forming)